MAFVWDPGAVLNVASGVLMGGLGAGLLAFDPDRDWNRLFGLLAVFWGLQIVTANTVRLTTDPGLARLAGELTLAFLIPLYFFVVSFASIFPRPRPPFGTSALAVAALALPAGGALAALFLRPETLLEGVTTLPDGTLTLSWGGLLPYLVTAPFFGSLSYALYVMMQRLDEARSPTERRQVGAVLAALGLYTAYIAPRHAVTFGAAAFGVGSAQEAGSREALLIFLVMAATVAILVVVVARLAQRARDREGPSSDEARRSLIVVGVGFAGAILVEAIAGLGGPSLELVGLFRTGSVALIVYGIARYQLFDLEVKAKRWTAAAAGLLAATAVGIAAFAGLRRAEVGPTIEVAGTALAALVAIVPALHTSYRLADRLAPSVTESQEHLYLRKLEVYRAAVEQRLAMDEPVEFDQADLVDLRERLGLDEGDHEVVTALARSEGEEGSARLEPGRTAFGTYEIKDVLAEGGYGRVLEARDTRLDRRVVIKELLAKWRDDPEIAERFLREARVAGQLDHPNIVTLYGLEEQAGDRYLVMEHVAGGTLADLFEDGPLEPKRAVRVTRQVVEALAAAHDHDVVHRDVKPANVLLDGDGQAKLTDFGIAEITRTEPDETLSGLTTHGKPPGTLAYMSPEQAAGRPVDERSDVYSAGALLYRCLTGQAPVPVDGLDVFEARRRIAEADTPPMDEVPEPLVDVLATALARDPADRYDSARAFAEALQRVQSDLPDAPTPG